ncbi:hypothetical protein WAI453_006101 [Rhynchosporium graminicola]
MYSQPRPRKPHENFTAAPASQNFAIESAEREYAIARARMQEILSPARGNCAPFLNLPPEIHYKISDLLQDAFDAICFSLVCKSFYTLNSPFTLKLPLSSGSPHSATPQPKPQGCRHCVPVLYAPAHCELHYHIKSFFPPSFKYCGTCERFTRCEEGGKSGSKERCGKCSIKYRRRYTRGRRLLQDVGDGVSWKRGSRWFNVSG